MLGLWKQLQQRRQIPNTTRPASRKCCLSMQLSSPLWKNLECSKTVVKCKSSRCRRFVSVETKSVQFFQLKSYTIYGHKQPTVIKPVPWPFCKKTILIITEPLLSPSFDLAMLQYRWHHLFIILVIISWLWFGFLLYNKVALILMFIFFYCTKQMQGNLF